MTRLKRTLAIVILVCSGASLKAQDTSAVTVWMDAMLEAIKNEEGRPTIHARNLFHASVVLYDAWAVYDQTAETYLLGKTVYGVDSPFEGPWKLNGMNLDSARNVTMNYAIYRFLWNRFNQYSSKNRTIIPFDDLFDRLGFDRNFRSQDYSSGSPAALGNYIAQCMINYSVQDGSNEDDQHQIRHYEPVNNPIKPHKPGTNKIGDPNRWQPIAVREYIDKRGFEPDLLEWNVNVLAQNEDVFLSPEWGAVNPFSLNKKDATINERDGFEYIVYNDPGKPPYINLELDSLDEASEQYKWGYLLVALWSSHHAPTDSVMIDISPGSIGPVAELPTRYSDYPKFFDLEDGGVNTTGHKINPYTQKPYKPNIVPRGDYSRVIAEYWVDGVNTYTPPGHWVKHLHDVSYHRTCSKKWKGNGEALGQLEWDVKAHLAMAGALHDAAIAAWGAKGWYDYVRPISAIRLMAEKGQCSDKAMSNYHPAGLPIVDGRIEAVTKTDSLAGKNGENVGKLKMMSWQGPDQVKNQLSDQAGVGWVLVENWWPYQRYSFVTPPFAGYISGHSTFSIAAADVLTAITGDPFFPEGLAEFTAKKDEFLIFEQGPSQDITLQWATYREAAEETCLSRVWGGIHPPADDIQGRLVGEQIAKSAVIKAESYFDGMVK
ncbi:MAG: vanadium-dependent haloperoxidase [Flavobacteriales bacterium]